MPYLSQKRAELNLAAVQCALLIFDNFKGQCTEAMLKLLDENNVSVVLIPPNCTDRLQPLDVTNCQRISLKEVSQWYAENICDQLEGKLHKQQVDLRMSVVKPLGAKWMVEFFDYLKTKPDIVSKGFKKSVIYDVAIPL